MKYSLISMVLFTAVACGAKKRPSADKPYRAVVISLTSVDSDGKARFGLTEKTFPGLNDLDSLDGTYIRFMRGGELSVSEVNGSIVSEDSFSGGSSPDLRYTIDHGVVIASDYSSLAMLSSFYQMDYIYSQVQGVLGIDPAKLQEKLPGGKHTILFEPQIVFKLDAADGSAGVKLNAAFSPKDKQFLMFQRSGIENVPLSGNLQVLSHEFGHFVFDYTFFQSVYDEKNYLGESYSLHGLNEGWADFVSWNFTTSPDILRSSIDIDAFANERHITKTTFKWDDIVSQSLANLEYDSANPFGRCSGSFYCIGTIFARSLIQAKAELPAVANKDFALAIVTSLQSTQAEMKAMAQSILPTALETDGDEPGSSAAWSRQGRITGAFLRALVKNTSPSFQTALCTKFKDNFGLGGFPTEARDGVCP